MTVFLKVKKLTLVNANYIDLLKNKTIFLSLDEPLHFT
jgi:hypothetical protein